MTSIHTDRQTADKPNKSASANIPTVKVLCLY